MSGHYTNRAGPWHTIMGRSFLRVGEMTLGQAFLDNGYETGMLGNGTWATIIRTDLRIEVFRKWCAMGVEA